MIETQELLNKISDFEYFGEIIIYSFLFILFILMRLACKLGEKVSENKWDKN